jgi:hypothetical protein
VCGFPRLLTPDGDSRRGGTFLAPNC